MKERYNLSYSDLQRLSVRERTRRTWGTERRTGDRWTDRDEQRDEWTERRTDRETDGDGQRDGRTAIWTDGDGQRDGRTEIWTNIDGRTSLALCETLHRLAGRGQRDGAEGRETEGGELIYRRLSGVTITGSLLNKSSRHVAAVIWPIYIPCSLQLCSLMWTEVSIYKLVTLDLVSSVVGSHPLYTQVIIVVEIDRL